jgi:hypothetical protein
MIERLTTAIREASGIKARLIARDGGSVVGGESEAFALAVANSGSKPVTLDRVAVNYCEQVQLGPGEPQIQTKLLTAGQTVNIPVSGRSMGVIDDPTDYYTAVRVPRKFQKEAIRLETTIAGAHLSLPVDSNLSFLPDVEVSNISPKTAVAITSVKGAKARFSMTVKNNLSTRYEGRIGARLIEDYPEREHELCRSREQRTIA